MTDVQLKYYVAKAGGEADGGKGSGKGKKRKRADDSSDPCTFFGGCAALALSGASPSSGGLGGGGKGRARVAHLLK
eukprot:785204-Pyramimonas_sp.AAC.1